MLPAAGDGGEVEGDNPDGGANVDEPDVGGNDVEE